MDQALHNQLVQCLPALRRSALKRIKNPDLADELVQETMARALAALPRFENRNMQGWLTVILKSRVWLVHRRASREIEDPDGHYASTLSMPPAQEEAVEFKQMLLALNKLSPEHRTALVLIAFDGMSYEDAASAMHCAVGTVKSRVNRARVQLAELLGVNINRNDS